MKLETSMAQSPIGNSRRRDDVDFNLREWTLKAKISRENTNSRRFSASYIRSFREDAKSFRSNIPISSTASSPGYTLREEIDPSTYSFSNALKALQAKTIYSWEYMSPDGLALNSKWNEAEKYICNPLSGEVPLECLSAKTLSGRSFRQFTNKITMSAPLIYPSQYQSTRQFHQKVVPHLRPPHELKIQIPSKEKGSITRDVGTQSNYLSSKSPSPARTPSIEERSTKRCVADDSPITTPQVKSEDKVEVKERRGKEETKRSEEQQDEGEKNNDYKLVKQQQQINSTNSSRQGCLLSWGPSLCMRQKQKQQHNEKKHNKSIRKKKKKNIFLCHINGC